MSINEIQNLIRFVAKSGVREIELEMKEFKITIKNINSAVEIRYEESPVFNAITHTISAIQPPVISTQPETISIEEKGDQVIDELKFITIRSPMIGTFYKTSGQGKPNFVNIGDVVQKGQTLCIIEAMKLFNEIESEVSGKILKILMDDANPVEYDTPLFLIDPS